MTATRAISILRIVATNRSDVVGIPSLIHMREIQESLHESTSDWPTP
jgi:hypothetical protein